MVDDFAVLVAELERCFGTNGVLPTRSELREMNRCASPCGAGACWSCRDLGWLHFVYQIVCKCRSDLEKAISAHGGPTVVAQQLGWKLKAKGR